MVNHDMRDDAGVRVLSLPEPIDVSQATSDLQRIDVHPDPAHGDDLVVGGGHGMSSQRAMECSHS